jgi:lactate dehydrogenase-like 2-hydroxyacid dehydrogenase
MKKNAMLVNVACRMLVDLDKLTQALCKEWIWGDGLDVVEGEPHMTISVLTIHSCGRLPRVQFAL